MTAESDAARTGSLDAVDYRLAVTQAIVPLDVRASQEDHFRGTLAAAETGDIHVFDIAADEHAVHRTSGLVAASPDRYAKFSVITEGEGLLVQHGRETRLGPGDMALYDTARPYSLLFDAPMRMSVVMFPASFLDRPAETLTRLAATRLDDAGGVGSLIRPYLTSLARDAQGLDAHVARRLFRTAVDMVGTLLAANLGPEPDGAHDVLHRRVLAYIDENLHDPELDPGRIAAAHFVSVRHLHVVFSEQGTTVSTVLRTRRLERCYDVLVDPRHRHRTVAEIAFAHGFVDPAHFSRSFRTHFGVTPRSMRP